MTMLIQYVMKSVPQSPNELGKFETIFHESLQFYTINVWIFITVTSE